jgi:hypothetical protein
MIALAQFKEVGGAAALCDAVMNARDELLPINKLQTLVELCPENSETSKISRFRLRPGEKLGPVESFLLELSAVDRIKNKAESLLFRATVGEQVRAIGSDIRVLTTACNEVLQSLRLAGLLQTILAVGNILNESSGHQVGGFALSSLPKLLQTKSPVDRTCTVVDFLIKMLWPPPPGQADHGWAQRERLLLFSTELGALALAWRLPPPGLQLQHLVKLVKLLKEEVKMQRKDEEEQLRGAFETEQERLRAEEEDREREKRQEKEKKEAEARRVEEEKRREERKQMATEDPLPPPTKATPATEAEAEAEAEAETANAEADTATTAESSSPSHKTNGMSATGALFASLNRKTALGEREGAGGHEKEQEEKEKERLKKIRLMRKEAAGKEEATKSASAGGTTPPDLADPKFLPYQKMRKMGLPDGPIRQKMLASGESSADVAAFFGEPAPVVAPAASAAGGGKSALLASIRSNANAKVKGAEGEGGGQSALFASIRAAKLKKGGGSKSEGQGKGKGPSLTPQQMLMASIAARTGGKKSACGAGGLSGRGRQSDEAAFRRHLDKEFKPTRLLQVLTECEAHTEAMMDDLDKQHNELNVSAAP